MGDRWPLLLVEDSPTLAGELEAGLVAAGAEVFRARTVTEAIGATIDQPFEVAVVGVELPGESGLALLQHFREDGGALPVLLVSRHDDADARAEAFLRGADDYLVLPVAVGELVARVQRRRAVGDRCRDLADEAQRLHGLTMVDAETQVANERAFEQRLREEFRRAQRYDDPLALMAVSLDDFAAVREALGPRLAGEVLRAAAGALEVAARDTDLLARTGAGTFSALLPRTNLAGALTVAERMVEAVRAVKVGAATSRLGASIGISSFPGRQVKTADELVTSALEALALTRAPGHARICLYRAPGSPLAP